MSVSKKFDWSFNVLYASVMCLCYLIDSYILTHIYLN